jgi:hypothetical protein
MPLMGPDLLNNGLCPPGATYLSIRYLDQPGLGLTVPPGSVDSFAQLKDKFLRNFIQ